MGRLKSWYKYIGDRVRLFGKSRVIRKAAGTPAWVLRFRRWVYGFAFLGLAFLIVESGLRWQVPAGLALASTLLDYVIFIAFCTDAALTFFYTVPRSRYFRTNWLDVLVFMPIILNAVSIQAGTGFIVLRNVVVIVKVFTRTRKFSRILMGIRLNTAQIVAFSFIGTILIGTLLLTFPAATTDGKGTAFIDALFTATSATCVTGLIVQDTPVYFSTFGQVIILGLIQLGGLGIMTYSAFIALLFGRFSLGQRKLVQEMFEEERNILGMVAFIFKMTFIIELIGVLLLFARWIFHYHHIGKALYVSVFHSVSAFCNAGFSLFSDSLSGFMTDPAVNLIIMALIFIGGIGFIVVHDINNRILRRSRISPHSKIVLIVSAVLILAGFFVVFFFEFDGVLRNETLPAKLWSSIFQSVTTRTAGFNTFDISALSRVTLTIMIILMFIGASPGSTGGGIKTSTFAILILSVRSIFRREERVEVLKRSIPANNQSKAIAILVASLILVSSIFVLLLSFEDKPYLDLMFETVSAFGTVGLSTGITPDLSAAGKLLITLLMYLGRIGPLTLGLALAADIRRSRIAYPEARIMIG